MKCTQHQPYGDLECNDCYIEAQYNAIKETKTAEEARTKAIEWQHNASDQNYSIGELLAFNNLFTMLAYKFNLIEEFKENGLF